MEVSKLHVVVEKTASIAALPIAGVLLFPV
jgi:hypothetical protein